MRSNAARSSFNTLGRPWLQVAARCGFHLPQQRNHFRRGQPPPGTDAAMADKPRNRRIQLAFQEDTLRVFRQCLCHVAK